jgi:hypothetical protein
MVVLRRFEQGQRDREAATAIDSDSSQHDMPVTFVEILQTDV